MVGVDHQHPSTTLLPMLSRERGSTHEKHLQTPGYKKQENITSNKENRPPTKRNKKQEYFTAKNIRKTKTSQNISTQKRRELKKKTPPTKKNKLQTSKKEMKNVRHYRDSWIKRISSSSLQRPLEYWMRHHWVTRRSHTKWETKIPCHGKKYDSPRN